MSKPLLAICLMPAGCTHGPAEPGWTSMFDGRTLAGWVPKITGYPLGQDPLNTFRAQDGTIVVAYDDYPSFAGRFGHLAYRTPLAAYRLRFEYRFTGKTLTDVEAWQQSNSGVMVHGQSPATMGLDQKFPVSAEVQLLGSERAEPGPTANLCTPGTHVVLNGVLERQHCIESSSPILPNGRWTRVEIEVDRQGNVTHFVEGQPVLRYGQVQYDPDDDDARPLIAAHVGLAVRGGYIYLQSEGHPVAFRKLEVLPLD